MDFGIVNLGILFFVGVTIACVISMYFLDKNRDAFYLELFERRNCHFTRIAKLADTLAYRKREFASYSGEWNRHALISAEKALNDYVAEHGSL